MIHNGHCVMEVDKMAQVGLAPGAGDQVALITTLDGNSLSNLIDAGYFIGEAPSDGTFGMFSVHSDCPETVFGFCKSITAGSHTLYQFVYTTYGGEGIGDYQYEVGRYTAPAGS